MTEAKQPVRCPWQKRQTFSVCGNLSFYGYADEHREAIRRITSTDEYRRMVEADCMVKMRPVDGVAIHYAAGGVASEFAEAERQFVVVATKILDDLEAECRAKDISEEQDR